MEKRANEFLKLSGEQYELNKKKWKKILGTFNDDVYNQTILNVYDAILKGKDDCDGDMVAYWFKSFKNNLKRNKEYIKNKDKEDLAKADKLVTEEDEINLYYSKIRDIFYKVSKHFDKKTFEIFRMYMLCNMSYEELDRLTGLDSKERITKVRQWLNGK